MMVAIREVLLHQSTQICIVLLAEDLGGGQGTIEEMKGNSEKLE